MHHSPLFRVLSLVVAICLVGASLPAEAFAPAPTEPDPLEVLAGDLFVGQPVAAGVLRRSVEGPASNRLEYLYTPADVEGRQSLTIEVAPDADRLVLSVLTHGGGPAPWVKLIDPAGRVFVPGQTRGNGYDELANGNRIIRRQVKRGARSPAQRALASIEAQAGPPGDRMDFSALAAGSWVRDDVMGNVALIIPEPAAGKWHVRVTGAGAPALLSVGSLDSANLRADLDACAPDQRASFCTSFLQLFFNLVKSAALVAVIAYLAINGIVVGGLVVAFVAADLIFTVVKAIGDIFVGLGILPKGVFLEELFDDMVLTWGSIQLIGSSPVGAVATFSNFFTKKLFINVSRHVCTAVGLAGPVIPKQSLAVGIVEQDYQAQCSKKADECQVSTLNTEGNVTYKVKKGKLPGGMSLDPTTGRFVGVPFKIGRSAFTVQVTDRVGKAERKMEIWVFEEAGKKAELVPDGVSTADEIGAVKPGQKIRIKFGVKNAGDKSALGGQIGLYWATARQLDRRVLIQHQDYPALSPEFGKTYSANFNVPRFEERGDQLVLFVEVDTLDTTAEGNEKNNLATVLVPVTENAPFKVTSPRGRAKLEVGKTVSIEWDNSEGTMSSVRIYLLQRGRRLTKIFDGDTGVRGSTKWKVPDRFIGGGMTIEVDSKSRADHWAKSGAFSILEKDPRVDLTGTWAATRTIRGPNVVPVTDKGDVSVKHNLNRGAADVIAGGTTWGTFLVRKDGSLEMTHLLDSIPQDTNDNTWEGNAFKAPNLRKVTGNTGTYTANQMKSSVTLTFHVEGFGDLAVTYAFTGKKK
jgi:hypothetical protein